MSLNIWALSIAKSVGLDYPAFQLVFIRAIVGLILMVPWIWREQRAFRDLTDLPLHVLRVGLSTIALTTSFFAIARLPIALFTAVNFTRPLILMVMAALILRETIPRVRWVAAGVGLIGVIFAIQPSEIQGGWGLPALFVTVVAGTGAVIVTRRLNHVPTVVMMTFYGAGLAVFTAPFAIFAWQPVPTPTLPILLAIGVFAQLAQFCFLRAHRLGQAGFLAVLSYTSLVISTTVGYLIFEEVPLFGFWIGAGLIIAAAIWVSMAPSRFGGPR